VNTPEKPKKISTWWRKCRVVSDGYSGYEVQWKYIWFPIWLQYEANIHSSIENAKLYANSKVYWIEL